MASINVQAMLSVLSRAPIMGRNADDVIGRPNERAFNCLPGTRIASICEGVLHAGTIGQARTAGSTGERPAAARV